MEDFTGELVQEVNGGKVIINFLLGKKDGPTKFIDKNGVLLSEINYKNDVMHGELKQYYSSGNLMSMFNYENGLQNGPFLSFYENGMKQSETNYVDGKTEGIFVVFDEFGDKISEFMYKEGKKNGKSLVYYPKSQGGQVYELSYYENNLLQNDKTTFYPTGEVMSITPYIKGKAQAYTKKYSPKGAEI